MIGADQLVEKIGGDQLGERIGVDESGSDGTSLDSLSGHTAASAHLARQLFTSGSNVSKSIFVACHLKRKVQSIEDFSDQLLSVFIICRLMSLKTEMFESTVKFRLLCIDGHTNNDVHLKNPLIEPTVFC